MHIDWVAVAALGSLASFAATLLIGAFVHGRLTERVAGHDTRILKLETRADASDSLHTKHATDIAQIKAHLRLDK